MPPCPRLLRHLFASGCVLLMLAPSSRACEKTLRWNDDPPFSFKRADGTVAGIDVDMNRELLRRLGCSVRLLEMPWARALQALETGSLDILPGAFKNAQREHFAYFSKPVSQSRNMLFVRRDALGHWSMKRLLDLRNSEFKLGVQIGVAYGPDYASLLNDPNFSAQIQRVSSRISLWKMLDLRRIDGVIADEMTGHFEIAQLGLHHRLTVSPVVVSDETVSVAFSKKSVDAAFVARYDQALQAMRKDGAYPLILQNYTRSLRSDGAQATP